MFFLSFYKSICNVCVGMYVNIVMPQLQFLPAPSFGLDMCYLLLQRFLKIGHTITFFFRVDLHKARCAKVLSLGIL